MHRGRRITSCVLIGTFLLLGSLGSSWNELAMQDDVAALCLNSVAETLGVTIVFVRHKHGDDEHWHTHRIVRSKASHSDDEVNAARDLENNDEPYLTSITFPHLPHIYNVFDGVWKFGLESEGHWSAFNQPPRRQEKSFQGFFDRRVFHDACLARGPPTPSVTS